MSIIAYNTQINYVISWEHTFLELYLLILRLNCTGYIALNAMGRYT